MTFALLATSAIAPSLILVWFFHARDAFPEPPRVLWTTFFLGMAIVAPVLLFAWPAYMLAEEIDFALAHGLVAAFFGAAIPEEMFKLLVLWGYSMRRPEFDEPMDGIVYGATASLGFATLENVLYVSGEGGATAIIRAFTAVPGHAFLGAIMGYYVGRARFADNRQERRALLVKALVIPILLHGAYDFPLLAANALEQPDTLAAAPVFLLLILVPVVLAVELLWTARLLRGGRLAQLAGGPPAPAVVADSGPAPEVPAALATPHPAPPHPAPPPPEPSPPEPPAPAPPVPAATEAGGPAPLPGRFLSWVLTVLGGLIASGGGLMILGVGVGLMIGGGDKDEVSAVILGTIVIGFVPAVTGSGLFLWGVARLNRSG